MLRALMPLFFLLLAAIPGCFDKLDPGVFDVAPHADDAAEIDDDAASAEGSEDIAETPAGDNAGEAD